VYAVPVRWCLPYRIVEDDAAHDESPPSVDARADPAEEVAAELELALVAIDTSM
jgi:hypothetical protein